MELLGRFSDRARKAMQLAHEQAVRDGCLCVWPEHLLIAISQEGGGAGAAALRACGGDNDVIMRSIGQRIGLCRNEITRSEKLRITCNLERVVESAIAYSGSFQHSHVGTEHLMVALMREDGPHLLILKNIDIDPQKVIDQVEQYLGVPMNMNVGSPATVQTLIPDTPPQFIVVDAIRDVAASLQRETSIGSRPNKVDAFTLAKVLFDIAEKITTTPPHRTPAECAGQREQP